MTDSSTALHDPARLLGSLGHAVIVTDLPGTVRFWNPAAERLYGWTAAEALGQDIATLTVPRMTQSLGEEIMGVLRGGGQWSGGFTVSRKDGSTFPALVTNAGIRDDAGVLVGIVGVSTDLGHALQPLLARSSDAALVLTPDATISYLSPAAVRLFGWADPTVLGSPLWALVHPEDQHAAIDHHRRVMSSSAAVAPQEYRLRTNGDAWCWAEVVMTNMLDDPAVRGLVCNLRDVTERRNDRDRLARLSEQLQTALTSRVVIDRATGLLAGRTGTDLDAAFRVMRGYTRRKNLRLHDVAEALLAGKLDLSHEPVARPPAP